MIPGRLFRNRAVDGDQVAVQLLPKSEWRSKINRLAVVDDKNDGNDDDDVADADDEKWERRADVLPTGKIVGIVQRNWKNVIAAFQPG